MTITDSLRKNAHETQNEYDWSLFRAVKKEMKIKIKDAKRNFYRNALSSRRPKEVWQMIHRILNPNYKPLSVDPNQLNQYFNTTSERLTPKLRKHSEELKSIIDNLANQLLRSHFVPQLTMKLDLPSTKHLIQFP